MSWTRKKQEYVDEYLRTHPCVDCGETDPIYLEFDHRIPADKTTNISRAIRSMGMERLMKEIEKCDIRCANDHKKRHILERVFSRGTAQVE